MLARSILVAVIAILCAPSIVFSLTGAGYSLNLLWQAMQVAFTQDATSFIWFESRMADAYARFRLAFAGDSERNIWVWDVPNRKLIRAIKDTSQNQGMFPCYAFSADGKLAIMGNNRPWIGAYNGLVGPLNTLGLFDLTNGRILRTSFLNNKESVSKASLSSDGRWALSVSTHKMVIPTGSGDRAPYRLSAVRLWDTSNGNLVRMLLEECGSYITVGFSPDGKLCAVGARRGKAAGFDNVEGWNLKLWDTGDGRPVRSLEPVKEGDPTCMAFSPDGKHVATGSYRTVTVWNVATGKLLSSNRGACRCAIKSVAFSPDGKFVLTAGPATDYLTSVPDGTSGSMVLLDAVTGKEVSTFDGTKEWVRSAGFTSDGNHVFGATAKGIQFWAADTGKALFTLKSER